MTGSPRPWPVWLAMVLIGLGVVAGVGLIVLGFVLMGNDPGFLFAILPLVFLVLTVAGLAIAGAAGAMVLRLYRRAPGVRTQVALFGGCLVISAGLVATESTPAALFLGIYGGLLLALMATPGAARDLGDSTPSASGPGSFPGSPRPRPAPGAGSSAETRPWWETWRAGLAQGMPLWERCLVAVALVIFAIGLLAVPLGFALVPAGWPVAGLSIPLALAVVWFVEQRMKARLSGR